MQSTPTNVSGCPVQARPSPCSRLIGPDPKYTLCSLDFVNRRPLRNEGACEYRVEEVDRHRIVEHPAHPARRHCPAIGSAILVQPRAHFGMALAEAAGWNVNADTDGKAKFGPR
jgi:hypothetical protein